MGFAGQSRWDFAVTCGGIKQNIDQIEFYIFVPCIGMVIYGLHRVFLSSTLELVLYMCNYTAVSNYASQHRKLTEYPSALAKFFSTRHKSDHSNLSGYLMYRWSIQHYVLILSELLFVFYLIHEPNSFMDIYKSYILFATVSIFIPSLFFTIIMYRTEKELFSSKI